MVNHHARLTYLLISMSMAPPPGTTDAFFTALRTIMMASCKERSASSMNCSDPPLKTMVAVLALGHPVNRLYRSAPTCHHQARQFCTNSAVSSPGQELIEMDENVRVQKPEWAKYLVTRQACACALPECTSDVAHCHAKGMLEG